MARLSLCMIVKNEERMLPGCLASVKGLVDEMIVVDTGSTDGTVALARRAGAQVFHHPWNDDFSAPRNEALRHAKGDYVLVLDADERIAPESHRRIKQALSRKDLDCGMLRLHDATRTDAPVADVLAGTARTGDPVRVPRVLRRTADLRFDGIIHENVTAWLVRRGGNLRFLDADIVHLGGAPDLRTQLKKSERNIGLLCRRVEAEPDNQLVYGFLAHELLNAGRSAEAWEVVQQGWAHIHRVDRARGDSVLRLATARARILLEANGHDGALATVAEAEKIDGPHPDLDHLRGLAYELAAAAPRSPAARHWRLVSAAEAYRAGIARKDTAYAQNFVVGATGWAGYTRLGTVQLLLGDPAGAMASFDHALALRPGHREAALGRVEALLDGGNAAGALAAVEPLMGDDPDGWLLAALSADALGALEDMKTFITQSRARADAGFTARHRRDRHGAMLVALAAYMGRPVPGPGTVGAMAALLAGAALPEASEGIPPDPLSAVRFAMNMVRAGRGVALGRLVGPRAESVLPGLSEVIHAVAQATEVPLPTVPVPVPVWLEAPDGPARVLVEAVLAAHPGMVRVSDRAAALRVVRVLPDGAITQPGSTAVTADGLLTDPLREVDRLTAALGVPRCHAMVRVLIERYQGRVRHPVPTRNESCSDVLPRDRASTAARGANPDPAHEVHA